MAIASVATIYYVCSTRGYSMCEYIPHVAHDKLLETCMFHATRKRGPRKHVRNRII